MMVMDPFGLTSGIEFNKDGTKLFVSYGNKDNTWTSL